MDAQQAQALNWRSWGAKVAKLSPESDEEVLDLIALGLIVSFALAAMLLLGGITAPYGRYSRPGWGFMLPFRLAWCLQEATTLATTAWGLARADLSDSSAPIANPAARVLLGCFVLHYFNRTVIFPLRVRGGKGTPLAPFLMALGYCCVNGYLQSHALIATHIYPSGWVQQPCFVCGVGLFLLGIGINYHSDSILRGLRKEGDVGGYKIPRGGMFEYVSGANYFGEILEWGGFALAAWSLPALSFALCTVLNLGPRALHHHAWYQEHFKGKYPSARKALIPFVL